MSSQHPRETAYAWFIYSNLPQAVQSGGGQYNYSELASLVGLKPTNNFRRRVKQLVEQGKINAVAVFTARNGIEARFQSPDPISPNEVPF